MKINQELKKTPLFFYISFVELIAERKKKKKSTQPACCPARVFIQHVFFAAKCT